MKKKALLIIILIVVGTIAIGLSLSFLPNNNQEKDNLSHKETVINTIEKEFYSSKNTVKDLEEITKKPMISQDVFMGKGSALRLKPDNKVMTRYDLSKYESVINKYAPIVEKRFLKNTKYTVKENESGNLEFKIKPWYFYNYSSDLSYLTDKILDEANFDMNKIYTDEFFSSEYKARSIAIKIMNDHLDNYDNKDETVDFTFFYENGKPTDIEYFSLYLNLCGATTKNSAMKETSFTAEQETRVTKYLKEAEKKGLINMKKPLSLENV